MQFLCDKCGQKYHVADEKVRGRAVTRFKCKKCEHIIELRAPEAGTAEASDDATTAGEIPESLSIVPAPPVAPTAPPPAVASAARAPSVAPRPAGTSALPSAPRPSTSGALPARPAATAAATASKPAAAPLPSAPRPTAAPRPTTGTSLPTASRIGAATAPAASARPTGAPSTATAPRPASAASLPLRSTGPERRPTSSASALLNASETGWYAGVRDLPVGPLTRNEVAARIESGDITPESLVWREGLDDWRPLRLVDELSDLLRTASQKLSDGLLGTMGRRDAPATGGAEARKVVPIAQARPAPSLKGDFGADDDSDDEPTRMTSLADLVAKAEAGHAPPKTAGSSEPGPVSGSKAGVPASSMSGRHGAMSPSVAPPPPASALSGKHPSIAPAPPLSGKHAAATPSAVTSSPPASPSVTQARATESPSLAPVVAAPLVSLASASTSSSSPPASSSAPFSMAPVGAPVPVASSSVSLSIAPKAKQQIPVGIWIMMAAVLVVGVAVGLVLRPSAPAPTAPPAPVRAPAPVPTTTRQVGAEIHLDPTPAAPAPPAPVEPASAAAPAPPAPAAGAPPSTPTPESGTAHRAPTAAAGAHAPSTGGPAAAGGGVAHALSAAQLAQLNSALGATPEGVAQSTGPTSSQLRNAPASTENNGGLSGAARAGQVIEALRRSNVVSDCWTRARSRNPAHPAESLHVTLDVSPSGRATSVTIVGATDADLASCIQSRSRSQFFGAGGSVAAEASFNLVTGQ